MQLSQLQQNIINVQSRIPSGVDLVAVSKYHPAAQIEAAYTYGLRDFGENYIQEWLQKSQQLSHLKDLKWHIIGPVQSNKAKFLNDSVYCLQSLSTLSLAQAIEKKSPRETPLNVLIQLTVDPLDSQKSGISFAEAASLCEYVNNSKKMTLKGFMGIGPANTDSHTLKDLFHNFIFHCETLWNEFAPNTNEKSINSLGMSHDLEIALECGSNMVRVGTAIFGERVLTR